MKAFLATAFLRVFTVVFSISLPAAQAHTYLTQPLAEFKPGASKVWWVAEFSAPWPGSFTSGADYARVAQLNGYRHLRSFLETKGPTCGSSLPNAPSKPIPSDGVVKLARAMEYPGPCEVWLNDERVYDRDDCKKVLGSATSFKVDFSSCKGSCMLRWYWLGLQDGGKRWHSYKNCVPLKESRSLDDEDEEEQKEEDKDKGDKEEYTFDDLQASSNDTQH